MYRFEKTSREERYKHQRQNPSFSSSLLDEIYRSIDDGAARNDDELKFFYREKTMEKKQSREYAKNRDCLADKWMEKKKISEKIITQAQRRHTLREMYTKPQNFHDLDHDALFFSSSSTSSDSSCGGFSSSDTESMFGTKSANFAPPNPIRTRVSAPKIEETLIKPKSRALKFYSKVKQPISPGGRLATFINSLFTPSNSKKTKISLEMGAQRKLKSGQESTCSSASSFSRSCLSKNSPSRREKLRNGVKRTVRFCPVSVIVDEDCRPCGQKRLYETEDSVWKLRKSPARKNEKERHQNQKKNDLIMRDLRDDYEDEDYDDDAASCASSDLFELDFGNNRYSEELPVYETTHVKTNRAIANGLIM